MLRILLGTILGAGLAFTYQVGDLPEVLSENIANKHLVSEIISTNTEKLSGILSKDPLSEATTYSKNETTQTAHVPRISEAEYKQNLKQLLDELN